MPRPVRGTLITNSTVLRFFPTPSHGVERRGDTEKYQTFIYTVEQITNQKKNIWVFSLQNVQALLLVGKIWKNRRTLPPYTFRQNKCDCNLS